MHPDGRIQQSAVRALVVRAGSLPVALLALRSADHVGQVREAALTGLLAHASVAEAHPALPMLLAVPTRQHGLHALPRDHDLTDADPDRRQFLTQRM
jgi:hypothetical protein